MDITYITRQLTKITKLAIVIPHSNAEEERALKW